MAGTTNVLDLLDQAVDENGVKMSIDLTSKTYLYLILSGVLIFTCGAIVWHYVNKKM